MATDAYSVGLVYASVCSDDDIEEMLDFVNREWPTGIASRWELADEETFASGDPNPMPCPDGLRRTHYLLSC